MLKKLAFATAGIALLASPLLTSAATVCPSLSRGMRGAEVTRLQQFLATQYTDFGRYVTGFYGPKTEAAVKQWQGEHGIEKLGFVGPKTAAAMGLCKTTADTQVRVPATDTQTAGTDTSKSALETLIQTLLQQIRDLQDQMAKLRGEQNTTPPPTTPPPAASCTWNGQTIASGTSVTAYQASSVAYGNQCVAETRTCTNGTLSGSNQYASCSIQNSTNLPACTQEAKLCSDGTAVGRTGPNCEFAACPSTPPLTCTPNAPQTQTLSCPTGQTGTIIQTRTSSCPGPTWSGWTTTTNTCTTPPPPASCTFNGQTIPSGTSVTAYQSATATQCVSEQRTCNNGTLSGSYTNSSCTVSGGTNATFSASPGSGNAPLGVTFSVTGLIGTTQMGINFGDGTTGSLTGTGTLTVTHTYSTAGTYSVAIYGGVAPGTLFNTTTLTVTVSGGGGTTSAVTCETNVANVPSGFGSYGYPMAAPMSGSAPLTVRFWVFVNMAGTVGWFDAVNFGDGSPSLARSTFPPHTQCPYLFFPLNGGSTQIPVHTFTHTYASPGTYIERLTYNGVPFADPAVTVTVTGPTSDAQRNSNLASALTALESALQAIQKFLGL